MKLRCPKCAEAFIVDDGRAGQKEQCPHCGQKILVPNPAAQAGPAQRVANAPAAESLAATPKASGVGAPPQAGAMSAPPKAGAVGAPPPALDAGGPPPIVPGGPPPFAPAMSAAAPAGKAPTGQATTSLVLGIVAIILWPLAIVAGPIGIIMGIMAMKKNAGRGMALAGIITSALGLVVMAAGAAFVMPLMFKARGMAQRVACGRNLLAIHRGMAMYQAENSDSYPWISNVAAMRYDAPMKAGADIYSLDGSSTGEGKDCNILQNLCLLVKADFVGWKTFRCPAVGADVMRRDSASMYGFQWDEASKTNYCDYGYQIGYASTVDGANAAPLKDSMDGMMPIMADRAPSADEAMADFFSMERKSNRGDGWNHGSDGVMVMRADGSAPWSDKTIMAGIEGNNLYQRDMDARGLITDPQGMKTPVCRNDSVLFWSRGD